jgi:hypothetical protein
VQICFSWSFLHKFGHPAAQRITDFIVGFGDVVVVVPLIRWRHFDLAPQIASINRFHLAFELGVLVLVAIDRKLSFSDLQSKPRTSGTRPFSRTDKRFARAFSLGIF